MDLIKPIYADYNATTPVDPAVSAEMIPCLTEIFGNPSSNHYYGRLAKEAVDRARRQVADSIGCTPREIIFTSGGTESNNMAIVGSAFANRHHGNHIITDVVEHPAVLQPCKYLERQGFRVTYLPVDSYGMVSVDDVKNAITDDTILITIMHANNEVGTIEPIAEVGELAKELGVNFHTDAAQSLGKIPVNVDDLAVDLLTIAGHKVYAPKGIGALYIREGTEIHPIIRGASQEFGLRAGTEAVASMVALGKAVQIATESLEMVFSTVRQLRERLYELIIMDAPAVRFNGHPTEHLPNTLNIAFPGVTGPDLLGQTPEVAASPGSACHAASCEPSPVLKAMGVEEAFAIGSIRLSLGRWSREDEIDEIAELLTARYERMLAGHVHTV
ncbi:MAG TPA: cysteine desulfurase family protein [Candidatus Aquicultor sp.]|jgi:cysteine desulfurase